MDTPDTCIYMIAGYIVIFAGLFIYIISLIWRFRNLHQEEHLLVETRGKGVDPQIKK